MATKKPKTAPEGVQPDTENPSPKAAATETKTTKAKNDSAGVLAAVGRDILKSNPELESVFVTADGQAFRLESDAKNHAANLKSQDVLKVIRNSK